MVIEEEEEEKLVKGKKVRVEVLILFMKEYVNKLEFRNNCYLIIKD